jgi:cellulose synthase/poly-beta-1,6-N-acetylglucosamine synthase-like glycosyltransferase
MELLPIIYLSYMFLSIYMSLFFILLYLRNRRDLFKIPKIERVYSLSMVVPCYNEEAEIGDTIKALLNSDYPGLKKIYVVDDCSKDRSYQVIKKYAQKYKKVVALQTPKNTGCAAGAKNYGAGFVKTELIGFTDADSFPEKKAISRIVGFFSDKKVAAAVGANLVRNRDTFFEKLQAIEYTIISWTRKLLNYVDAIYVTPGPLTIYRTDVFNKIGKFNENQMTEDIEMTWRLAYHGYKREMCPAARTRTVVPSRFKEWYNQRIRWNIGGLQCIAKYKQFFFRRGMLGAFILPLFTVSLFLGLLGLSIFFYLLVRRIFHTFLYTRYSFAADSSLITIEALQITPTVLNFFGIALFLLGFVFTIFGLSVMKEHQLRKQNFFNILIYLLVYLTIYPFIMINSTYKFIRKKYSWGTRGL